MAAGMRTRPTLPCHGTPGVQSGSGGYFTIPYTYLADDNMADDFWTIRLVK